MSALNRREFLGVTTAAAAALAAGVHASGAEETAKDRPPVRLALMGLNSRGKQLLPEFLSFPEVEIAYICDPDDDTVAPILKIVQDRGKPTPRVEKDFRKALEDPGLNGLICSAPDHWHALATILACQAGKDVYVEKPCCHNPIEGRRMVEAARHYNRVVQVGSQRRSGTDMADLVKEVQSGRLGKVNFVRCWIVGPRPNIGRKPVSAPPANLDYSLWAGPGPVDGYKTNLVHYHWHWRWDFGTGECGNNGIHYLDVARWALDLDAPKSIVCGGGKYFYDDDQETPDTQLATFDFPQTCVQWEHRTWSNRGIDGDAGGIEFYGSEANLIYNGHYWKVVTGTGDKEKVVSKHDGAELVRSHIRNFLDCTVSRERPNADIEINHKSTLWCHLANIAWRTGSVLRFDGQNEAILDNPEATALMGRTYRPGFELPKIG